MSIILYKSNTCSPCCTLKFFHMILKLKATQVTGILYFYLVIYTKNKKAYFLAINQMSFSNLFSLTRLGYHNPW